MTTIFDASFATTALEQTDVAAGFSCGVHALDQYFARHALPNHHQGIGRAYVLRRGEAGDPSLPLVLGFYTLSMAHAESSQLAAALQAKLPRYPMPVALIGRLAVDKRAQGRRLGEKLLVDAIRRVLLAAELLACVGVVVDAKDERAEGFYCQYGFVTVVTEGWPRRMFLPLNVARASFAS